MKRSTVFYLCIVIVPYIYVFEREKIEDFLTVLLLLLLLLFLPQLLNQERELGLFFLIVSDPPPFFLCYCLPSFCVQVHLDVNGQKGRQHVEASCHPFC